MKSQARILLVQTKARLPPKDPGDSPSLLLPVAPGILGLWPHPSSVFTRLSPLGLLCASSPFLSLIKTLLDLEPILTQGDLFSRLLSYLLFFFFLGPHPQHMEVPGPGVKSEW